MPLTFFNRVALAMTACSWLAAADYQTVPYSLANELESSLGNSLRTALSTTTATKDMHGSSNGFGYWIHDPIMASDGWIAVGLSNDNNWKGIDQFALRNPSDGTWSTIGVPTVTGDYAIDGIMIADGGYMYAEAYSDTVTYPLTYRYSSGSWSLLTVGGKNTVVFGIEWGGTDRLAATIFDSNSDMTVGSSFGTLLASSAGSFTDFTSKIPSATGSVRAIDFVSGSYGLGLRFNPTTETSEFFMGTSSATTWTQISTPTKPTGYSSDAEFESGGVWDGGAIVEWEDENNTTEYKTPYRISSGGTATAMSLSSPKNSSGAFTGNATMVEAVVSDGTAIGTVSNGDRGGSSYQSTAVIFSGTATSGTPIVWESTTYAGTIYTSWGWGIDSTGVLGINNYMYQDGGGKGPRGFELGVPVSSVGSVSLSANASTVTEGGSSATLTVSRTGSTLFPLTVNITVPAGDLTVNGSDGTVVVTIPTGQSSVTATLAAVDDALIESDESVTVAVAAATGGSADQSYSSSSSVNMTVSSDDVGILPTITGSTTTNSSTNTVTITFSESVTGFDASDLNIGNGTAGTVGGSGTTYTSVITASAEGTVTVDIAADAATGGSGNSLAATQFSFVYDATAPAAPTVDLATASDSGSSTSDDITNDNTPTIEGTAEANATVNVLVDSSSVGSTTADGSGNWSLTPSNAISDSTISVTATATDAAGNTGPASSALPVHIDTTAPAAPSLDLATASDSGVSTSDNITSDNTPDIVVTIGSEAGLTVSMSDDASGSYSSPTDNTDGTYTFALSSALSDATRAFSASAMDTAGNSSSSSSSLSVTVDTTAPTATLSGNGSTQSASPFDLTATFSEAVSNVDDTDFTPSGGTLSGTATSSTVYTVSVTPTAQSLSVTLATSDITDTAGNALAAGATSNITYNVGLSISPDGTTTASSPITFTFTFSGNVGSSFVVGDISATNGSLANFAEVTTGTVYTVELTPAADGSAGVSVASGAATSGGIDVAAASASVTYDTTKPTYSGLQVTINGTVANATSVSILDSSSATLGTGSTDSSGNFSIQVTMPTATETVTIQATDGTNTSSRQVQVTPNLSVTSMPDSNG